MSIDSQATRSLFGRIAAWWRSDTVQGILLGFVVVPLSGGWQVPLYSWAAGASIVRVGGLFSLSMVPLLLAFAFFAGRARATIRRCGVGALTLGVAYPVPMLLPVHFSLVELGSIPSWCVSIAWCVVLAAAMNWAIFRGPTSARDAAQ